MKKEKIFSRDPLIWFHYALLVGIIFLAYWIGGFVNLESQVWYLIALWYFAWISIGDQLIHFILGKIAGRKVD